MRALESLYQQPGPKGEPLKLLHRDLKPGNIQVTQSGQVKLLDFGFARADFEEREAKTMFYIGGTSGYLAPELRQLFGKILGQDDVDVSCHGVLPSLTP